MTLKHGKASKVWTMDKISNASFTEVSPFPIILGTMWTSRHLLLQREFDRLVKVCQHDNVKLPTKRQVEKKAAQLDKLANSPMTEVSMTKTDVAATITEVDFRLRLLGSLHGRSS